MLIYYIIRLYTVYGFCDNSAIAAVEEYHRRFPTPRIPRILDVFQGLQYIA